MPLNVSLEFEPEIYYEPTLVAQQTNELETTKSSSLPVTQILVMEQQNDINQENRLIEKWNQVRYLVKND